MVTSTMVSFNVTVPFPGGPIFTESTDPDGSAEVFDIDPAKLVASAAR